MCVFNVMDIRSILKNKLEDVIRIKKKVEVRFVPDELIGTIITDTEPISYKNDRNFRERRHFRNEYTPTSLARYTRSGRHIRSRFENLSIHDTDKKSHGKFRERDRTDSSDEQVNDNSIDKPSDCLFGDGDIEGKAMFSFKCNKKHNSMVNKATESINKLPVTPQTSLRKKQASPVTPKTPYVLRDRLKKTLANEVLKLELDELFEESGSDDYVPSSDDTESESTNDSDDFTPLDPELPKTITENKADSKELTSNNHSMKKRNKRTSNYIFTSEEYFDRQYNKVATSKNTLNKLKTPRLARNQLNELLKSLTPCHKQALKDLENGIEVLFRRWLFSLNEGYNILLYGLGSKREILRRFQEKYLSRSFVIVVNGYFPDLSLKEMLEYISMDMLGMSNLPLQSHEIIEMISDKLKLQTSPRIFILFNNIEGPMLRNDRSQTIISQIAQIPKIHVIATVDHINSPLLWDQKKLSNFNFIWEDATIFAPYIEETSFEGSLMVQRSGGLALTALKNVFQSLTANSRKVFKLLLKHQLETDEKKYTGMHFSELYRECRTKFIVSSDLALRTLLTEFLDHELVKWKKDTDHLIISIDSNVLKQFNIEMDTLER